VIDRKSDRFGRQIREAISIRKARNINQDDDSYQLSLTCDSLLKAALHDADNDIDILARILARKSRVSDVGCRRVGRVGVGVGVGVVECELY